MGPLISVWASFGRGFPLWLGESDVEMGTNHTFAPDGGTGGCRAEMPSGGSKTSSKRGRGADRDQAARPRPLPPDIDVRHLLSRQESVIFQNHLIGVPDNNPQLKAGRPSQRRGMERQETQHRRQWQRWRYLTLHHGPCCTTPSPLQDHPGDPRRSRRDGAGVSRYTYPLTKMSLDFSPVK